MENPDSPDSFIRKIMKIWGFRGVREGSQKLFLRSPRLPASMECRSSPRNTHLDLVSISSGLIYLPRPYLATSRNTEQKHVVTVSPGRQSPPITIHERRSKLCKRLWRFLKNSGILGLRAPPDSLLSQEGPVASLLTP